ncbi:hypothetical protein HK104_005542, partial [Borealophlyctis nickersoniae]
MDTARTREEEEEEGRVAAHAGSQERRQVASSAHLQDVTEASSAHLQDEGRRRREEEAQVAELALGGGSNDGTEGNEEKELSMGVHAQWAESFAMIKAENDELRNELVEQRRMMEAQTNLIQNLLSNLRLSGEASGAQPLPPQPRAPQPPAPQPPMLPYYPRAPSPTFSATPSTMSEVDQTHDITKSMLSTIKLYDGQGSAQKLYEFIRHLDQYFELAELPPKHQLAVAAHKLTGAADMMLASHQTLATVADKVRDWEGVKQLLLKRFTTKEQQLLVRKQLRNIKQTSTVTDYTHRFDMLLMQLPQRDTEESYVMTYLEGLKEEVRKAVSLNSDNLNDLMSLKSAALRYDQVVKTPTPRQQSNALTAQEEKQGEESAHAARGGRGGYRGRGRGRGRGGGGCGGNRSSNNDRSRGDWIKTAECACCGQTGHLMYNCPKIAENIKRIKEKNAAKKKESNNEEESAHTAYFTQVAPKAQVAQSEDRDRIAFIIDSGCTQHMTPNGEWLDPESVEPKHVKINTANGSKIESVEVGNIPIRVAGEPATLQDVLHVPELSTNLMS